MKHLHIKHLNLFLQNCNEFEHLKLGDMWYTFDLPSEFCSANTSERRIRIKNFAMWELSSVDPVLEYNNKVDACLCADFNQDDVSNENFVCLNYFTAHYTEPQEFEYTTNKRQIKVHFIDPLGYHIKYGEITHEGHSHPLNPFCIELELIYYI